MINHWSWSSFSSQNAIKIYSAHELEVKMCVDNTCHWSDVIDHLCLSSSIQCHCHRSHHLPCWNKKNYFCDLRIQRALTLKSVISSRIYIHGWWRCWTLVSRWARQKDNRRLMEHHHRPPDRQRRCWRWKEWQGITCPMTIGQDGWCDDNSEAENKMLSEWLTN